MYHLISVHSTLLACASDITVGTRRAYSRFGAPLRGHPAAPPAGASHRRSLASRSSRHFSPSSRISCLFAGSGVILSRGFRAVKQEFPFELLRSYFIVSRYFHRFSTDRLRFSKTCPQSGFLILPVNFRVFKRLSSVSTFQLPVVHMPVDNSAFSNVIIL